MYRISDGVRSTNTQDGAIVLDVRQGQIFNLNLAGSKILELLKSGTTESEIVDKMTLEFGVGREVVEADVREFLAALIVHRLIEEKCDGRGTLTGE